MEKKGMIPRENTVLCPHLQQGGSTAGLEVSSQQEIWTLSTSTSFSSPGSNDQLSDCLIWESSCHLLTLSIWVTSYGDTWLNLWQWELAGLAFLLDFWDEFRLLSDYFLYWSYLVKSSLERAEMELSKTWNICWWICHGFLRNALHESTWHWYRPTALSWNTCLCICLSKEFGSSPSKSESIWTSSFWATATKGAASPTPSIISFSSSFKSSMGFWSSMEFWSSLFPLPFFASGTGSSFCWLVFGFSWHNVP